jgi:predicted amidohydrolase
MVRRGVYLLMGLGVVIQQAPYLHNQTVLVDPTGRVVWTYAKARPAPRAST